MPMKDNAWLLCGNELLKKSRTVSNRLADWLELSTFAMAVMQTQTDTDRPIGKHLGIVTRGGKSWTQLSSLCELQRTMEKGRKKQRQLYYYLQAKLNKVGQTAQSARLFHVMKREVEKWVSKCVSLMRMADRLYDSRTVSLIVFSKMFSSLKW